MTYILHKCCKDIQLILNDKRSNVKYNSTFREYHIQTKRNTVVLNIIFCPWCGINLPEGLRNKFFDTLEQEYGIDTNIGEYKNNTMIPTEFRTDEWWKKRGL